MTVEERIRICKVLELMSEQPTFAREIGITNVSVFRGCKLEAIKEKSITEKVK
jgi:hypothetical protein